MEAMAMLCSTLQQDADSVNPLYITITLTLMLTVNSINEIFKSCYDLLPLFITFCLADIGIIFSHFYSESIKLDFSISQKSGYI
jgi:hypothetical protein